MLAVARSAVAIAPGQGDPFTGFGAVGLDAVPSLRWSAPPRHAALSRLVAARSQQRRRIVRRRRIVAAALVAALVALGFLIALQAGLGRSGGGPLTATGTPVAIQVRPAVARVWIVRPGDTLWSIVEDMGVKGDPRPVVDRLAAGLGGRPLQPGERILLP
jgi:hypothetical protein